MWTSATTDMIITGIGQTLYMTILSTVVGYVFGLPLGVMLAVFDKDGLRPNKAVYKVLDVISLQWQEVVHHREHTLLHLTTIPCVDDNLLLRSYVEYNGCL